MKDNTKEYAKAFGKTLKAIREDKKISQEALAFSCGLDRSFISLLERGLRQPTLTTIFVLASQLEILPEDLIRQMRGKR